MLPFLKPKQASVAGVIIKNRTPDKTEVPEEKNSIEDCAQDLINAIHAQDKANVIKALRDIIEKIASSPKETASPHTYDAQNIKAAKSE